MLFEDDVLTTRAVDATTSGLASAAPSMCAGCKRQITDRFLLKAVDRTWHEDCLRCSSCDCRLGRFGTTLFTRDNLLLCRTDYIRMYGVTGSCSACLRLIPSFELVMRARDDKVYHLDCFVCQQCRHRFIQGDRCFMKGDQLLCELDSGRHAPSCRPDYDASCSTHVSYPDHSATGTISYAEHHCAANNMFKDDASSGYGSPSAETVHI